LGLKGFFVETSSIYERLKMARKALNLSQRKFAEGVFVTQSYFADVELGKRNMSERIIHLLSTQYNINKEWLKTGEGEMFTNSSVTIQLGQLVSVFNELDALFQEYLVQQAKELLKVQKKNKKQAQ
jgi:transcriptional regulator with XRE-family HTH domain